MSEAYAIVQPQSVVSTSAITDVDPNENEVHLSINKRGYDIHIPPVRLLCGAARNSVRSTVDKVGAVVYPIPVPIVFCCAFGMCAYVWYAPAGSPIFTNRVSVSLTYLDSLNLFTKFIPPRYQPTALCAKVWVFTLGAATVVHRFLLRRALQYQGWIAEKDPAHPSLRTRLWAFVLRSCFTRRGASKTDIYERSLPSQPLPSLHHTVSNYLNSMRAICAQQPDGGDWIELRRAAESFLLNEGPLLQRHLRLHHLVSPNYMSDWYTRNALLASRQSLCLHSNYYTIPFAAFKPTSVQAARAAVITLQLVQLKQKIDSRDLPPHFGGPGNSVPLSMQQYFLAFNTTRIPGREIDTLEHDAGAENMYVVVLHAGRIFQVSVVHPRTRELLTPRQLESLFQEVLDVVDDDVISTGRDDSDDEDVPVDVEESAEKTAKKRSYRVAEQLIPSLTTAPRSLWADVRTAYFLHDANNNPPLRTIERALFVVSLEGHAADSQVQREGSLSAECAQYLCGDGSSLWCDKSFNVMVRQDGRVGVHVEHAWADLPTFQTLFEYVTTREEEQVLYDSDGHAQMTTRDRKLVKKPLSADVVQALAPKRLRFTLHKRMAKKIRDIHSSYLINCASQADVHVSRYTTYGKNLPLSLGCTPDAWMQMAIQLAYYADQGHYLQQMYESVTQHSFARGRTEAVRCVGDASCAFVRAMYSRDFKGEEVQAEAVVGHEERRSLLLAACARHQQAVQEAKAGLGIDRHLFALYMMSAIKQVPSDFLNLVLRKTKWRVSTVEASQRYLPESYHAVTDARPFETPSCGFGPISIDGYGVSYCFCGDSVVYITVTSLKDSERTSSSALTNNIFQALDSLAELSDVDVEGLAGTAVELGEIDMLARTATEKKKRKFFFLVLSKEGEEERRRCANHQ